MSALALAALGSLLICGLAVLAAAVAMTPLIAVPTRDRISLYAGSVACFLLLGQAWLSAAPVATA